MCMYTPTLSVSNGIIRYGGFELLTAAYMQQHMPPGSDRAVAWYSRNFSICAALLCPAARARRSALEAQISGCGRPSLR